MIKMNAKNLMVFFLALACILLVVGSISAAAGTTEIVTINSIEVDGGQTSVIAGETAIVKVSFTALETVADVRVKAELEGDKVDVEDRTTSFNIEKGETYIKTLSLKVPYELQDEPSSDLTLSIQIWNGDLKTEKDIRLRVERPSYNAAIMSIDASQVVEAGDFIPVDIVLKNTGYNNLDDLFVTVKITALGTERTSYFGDLIAISSNHDTETKRFFLKIPFDAKQGLYTLEVEAFNNIDDFSVIKTKQIAVKNEFVSNTIVTSMTKAVAVGEDAQFELILANPTDKLRVFRVITESNGDLSTSSNMQLVAIPAGMTKTVIVTAQAHSQGDYDFNVSIFAGEELADSVTLSVLASGRSASGSVVALTLILAIIFLVLLGVLIALLKKKPETAEEFGESYY